MIEDLQTLMRHPYFIEIGKDKTETKSGRVPLFSYRIEFASDISARLFYQGQNPVNINLTALPVHLCIIASRIFAVCAVKILPILLVCLLFH